MRCCQYCKERYIGCHSKCKLYIEEVKERKNFLKDKRNKKELDYNVRDIKNKSIGKRVRRNKDHYK